MPFTWVSVSVSRLCSTSDRPCAGSTLMSSTGPSFSVSVTAAAAAQDDFPTPPWPTKKMSRVGGSGGAAMGGIDGARTSAGGPSAALNSRPLVSRPPAISLANGRRPSRPRGASTRRCTRCTGTSLVEGLELADVRRLQPAAAGEGRRAGPLLDGVDHDLRHRDAALAQPGEERLGLGLAHRLGLRHEVERGPRRVLHQRPEAVQLGHQLVQRAVARRSGVLLLPGGLLAAGEGHRPAEQRRGVEERGAWGRCRPCPPPRDRACRTRAGPRRPGARAAARGPGTTPDTSFPTSSSAEEQPLGCPRGERAPGWPRRGPARSRSRTRSADSPPSPLPGTRRVGLPVRRLFQTSERALVGSELQSSTDSLGAASVRVRAKAEASVLLPAPPLPPNRCRTSPSRMWVMCAVLAAKAEVPLPPVIHGGRPPFRPTRE